MGRQYELSSWFFVFQLIQYLFPGFYLENLWLNDKSFRKYGNALIFKKRFSLLKLEL